MLVFMLALPQKGFSDQSVLSPHALVPDREIVVDGSDLPPWKSLWDEARRLTVAGEYEKAVLRYKSLLAMKDNLQEARWELARLHMHLQKWDEAVEALEILLEIDPAKIEYLNSLGRVMWESGQFERAVDLFGKAHEKDRDDQTALAGLVEGLIKLGRKKEALPFLEQLNRVRPGNPGVQRYLALFAFELGLDEKAKIYLVELAEKKDVDLEILKKTAQVHDRLGLAALAVSYWQRYLEREPASVEAHLRLADHFEKKGEVEKALQHLLIVFDKSGDKLSLLPRIGIIYEKSGKLEKALEYYHKYLDSYPGDNKVLRSLVRIQAKTGDMESALEAMEKYFSAGVGSDPVNLKMAAQLYDAVGRYHKAVPIYKQLIDLSPGDPEIHEAMVSDLLAIGENDGVLSVWKYLAGTGAPVRLSIYRSMASLLSRLDRAGELLEVLELINGLDPADENTSLQLATMYLDMGDTAKAQIHFEKLELAGHQSAGFFLGRGRLFERIRQAQKALSNYDAFLGFSPERNDIRLKCIRLAGLLGRYPIVEKHLAKLDASPSFIVSDGFRLVKAKALSDCGFYQDAIKVYREILAREPADPAAAEDHLQAWLEMASTYKDAGMDYESEQVLREALSREYDYVKIVSALFDRSLESGRSEDGSTWLHGLQQHQLFKQLDQGVSIPVSWRLSLLKIRLMASAGELRSAIRSCRNLFADLRASDQPADEIYLVLEDDSPLLQVGLELCRLLVRAGRHPEAEEMASSLLVEAWDDLEFMVLLDHIYNQTGEPGKSQDLLQQVAARDLEDVLRLSSIYMSYRNIAGWHKAAQMAVKMAPDSMKAQFMLAKALVEMGRFSEALAIFETVAKQYPDNSLAKNEIARLFFRAGRFDEALAYCEEMIKGQEESRPDMLLLKARTLWARQQWADSISVYQAFLAPPLDKTLADLAEKKGIKLDLLVDKSIWDMFPFRDSAGTGSAAVIMSPASAVDMSKGNKEINRLVSPYFSRYIWQERFGRELAARISVQRREYFKAVKEFEYLIRDFGADESLLYDLAGVYSSLGMLSEETGLYEELLLSNPDYPGLQEAVQRNRLKRRPMFSLAYGLREEDGWDKYKDIKEERSDARIWFSPKPRHEAELVASRIRYKSVNSNNIIWANRALFSYKVNLSKELLLSLGAGAEYFDDGYGDSGIYNYSLHGKLGDEIVGWVEYKKNVIADTFASLARNLTANEFVGGAEINLLPWLIFGGKYGHIDYSDENQGSNYSLWTSYIVFPEPTFLKLGYKYDFFDTRYGVNPGAALADGFALDDHPYWCPRAYALNRFGFFFKHLLAADNFARGVPRYYTIEYEIGYDSRGYDLHSIKGSLVVELTKHVIVSASGGAFSMKDYQGNEGLMSIAYRW